jgi:BirA family biotin operon repressor/biotin-[acetyl-CoA-carboxylase] ligase
MAIGIGINIEHAPDILGARPPVWPARLASDARKSVFQSARMPCPQLRASWRATQGIIPAWTRKASGMGGPISVQNGEETVEGTFDHLASDGALMVRLASGAIRAIRTGDIVIKPR